MKIELTVLVLFLCVIHGSIYEQCNWSNEACENDEDCCSGECYLAHEGTDYRCTRSSLSRHCVFDHHCRDGLNCGPMYNCCSPYWESCVRNKDCCNRNHVCQPTAGFVYKKCLYPSSGFRVTADFKMLAFLIFVTGLLKLTRKLSV